MATVSTSSPYYYRHLIRPVVHDHTASRVEDTGFRQAGLPVHVWKLRKTINMGRIKAVATTVVEEAKVYTLPACVKFDLGLAPVYWKSSDGFLPSTGGKLTLFHNPLNKLVPDNKFGIAFNGGFIQPIMCKGEPRAMMTKVRGKAVNLFFSFTNGVKWDGLCKLQFQVPKIWRNRPTSFFNEVELNFKIKMRLDAKGPNRLFTIGLVITWYTSNIGVLLLNKYLLGNYGFRYPIFLTMCHMIACSLLSYAVIVWMRLVPMQPVRSQSQFFKIAALSAIFCVSVMSGNVSLRYLPVSFNQAIGATTPFFTAVFAYLMTAKREAWLTYVTLLPVVTGVVIASGGEPSFHLFGFVICVIGVAARALKSVVQGILLSSDGDQINSMNLLLYMAPIAVVFLLPATLIMEKNVVCSTLALARDDFKIFWYLLFNSALAYFVNLTNFLVTKHTGALTLQVLGNAKGAVAVVISILIFRNPVSVTGMLGYTLTVIGVLLYTEAKKRNK